MGITKLLSKVTKDAFIAVQTLAGLKKNSLVDEKVQQSINKAIQTGNQALVARLATTNSIVEKSRILESLMSDMARNQGIAQVSQAVSTGLAANKKPLISRLTGKSQGFIPNYSEGYIPKSLERKEKMGARSGGYIPGEVVPSPIGGVMNTAESVVSVQGMSQPFINPPEGSPAAENHRKNSINSIGIDPYNPNGSINSRLSSKGFIPNFAAAKNVLKRADQLGPKVIQRANPQDTFQARINPVEMNSTVEELRKKSKDILDKVYIKTKDRKVGGKAYDEKGLEDFEKEYSTKSNNALLSRTSTFIKNIGTKGNVLKSNSSGYIYALRQIQGLLGEVEAKESFKDKSGKTNFTEGFSYFDLITENKDGSQTFSEVRARSQVNSLDILKKAANQNVLENNYKNKKTDSVKLGNYDVLMPKGSAFNSSGFIPNFAAITRRIGIIDGDALSQDIKKAKGEGGQESIVKTQMERLNMTKMWEYYEYLGNYALSKRKSGSLNKINAIFGRPGSGKTSLASNLDKEGKTKKSDDAKARNTTRKMILQESDIDQVDEVIATKASISTAEQSLRAGFMGGVDRLYNLETSNKDRKKLAIKRANENNQGVNLGRSKGELRGTINLPDDEGYIGQVGEQVLGSKSVRIGQKLDKDGNIKRSRIREKYNTEKRRIAFAYGAFAPFTKGHEQMFTQARSLGFEKENIVFAVSSGAQFKSGDAHSYRTSIFPADVRARIIREATGAQTTKINSANFRGTIPSILKLSDGSSVSPAPGSIALTGDDKGANELAKYLKAGYQTVSGERSEGISGTELRNALDEKNIAKIRELAPKGSADYLIKNLDVISNRSEFLKKLAAKKELEMKKKLDPIETELATLPARILTTGKNITPPQIAARILELRKQRDKIKESNSVSKTLGRATNMYKGLQFGDSLNNVQPSNKINAPDDSIDIGKFLPNNPNAQQQFSLSQLKGNKNVEFDDKINTIAFKQVEVKIPDKDGSRRNLTSSILQKAPDSYRFKDKNRKDGKQNQNDYTGVFERYAIQQANKIKTGPRFIPTRTTGFNKGNNAVDGFSIDSIQNKEISLLEAKAGDWTSPEVGDKFGRFLPENLVELSPMLLPLFTEGVPNEYDRIKLTNYVAVPDLSSVPSKDKEGIRAGALRARTGGTTGQYFTPETVNPALLANKSPSRTGGNPFAVKKTRPKNNFELLKENILREAGMIQSKGFIPNFSNYDLAKQQAINREVASGQKRSDVRVSSDNSLVTNFNPEGLGVYNKDEKTLKNGMGLARKEGIDPRTKGMFASSGFIPNFAADKNKGYGRGSVSVYGGSNGEDYKKGEPSINMMRGPFTSSTSPILGTNLSLDPTSSKNYFSSPLGSSGETSTASAQPRPIQPVARLANMTGSVSLGNSTTPLSSPMMPKQYFSSPSSGEISTSSAQLSSEQNTFQSSPPETPDRAMASPVKRKEKRVGIQQSWKDYEEGEKRFGILSSPAKSTSSISEGSSSTLSWTPMQTGMSSNLDSESAQGNSTASAQLPSAQNTFQSSPPKRSADERARVQEKWNQSKASKTGFRAMASPAKRTSSIASEGSSTLSWTPMQTGMSSNLDPEYQQSITDSNATRNNPNRRAEVQRRWDQRNKKPVQSSLSIGSNANIWRQEGSQPTEPQWQMSSPEGSSTSSIAESESATRGRARRAGMSSNLDPESQQSATASNALEDKSNRRGTAEMPPPARPGAVRRPTSMLKPGSQPGSQPGSSMETNEPDQAAKDEAKANKLSRFSTRMMGAGMAVPMLTGMLSTPEAGKEQTSGQKTLESVGEAVGAGVSAATTAAMIPGLAPLAPAIGIAVGGFKLLSSAAKNSVPSIKSITDSNDKLVAANEAQVASLNETVQKQEEISQLKSSGADPKKIARAQLELAKSMKGIGDAELVNTLTNEKDQGKKQSAIADFQEKKTKETNFSQGIAGTAALVQKSQMDNTKWYDGIYKSNEPKDRPELKSEDMGTFLNPIIDAMDLTKPASKEAAKGIEKLKNGTLSMGDFISKFGKEMGLSESQVSDASKSFENLSSNFNPKSISSLNEYAGQLLNVNNLIASTSATAEAPVLNIDFQKVFDKGLQDLTLDTALTNYKGYAEQTSNLDIEKNQFALDQQSGKFSKTAIIRKQSEMQGREQNMAFDKQGAGIVDKAVADLTSMLPKNLNTDQMSAILDESKNVLANGGDLTKLEDLIRASVGTTGESNDILQNIAKINEETTQAVEMLKTDRAAATKTRTAIEEANVQNAISANAADMGTSILKGDAAPSKNKLLDPEALAKNESKIMDLRYKADAAKDSGNTKGEKAARDEIKALELENARMRSEDLAAQEEQFGAVNVVGQEAEQAGRESIGKQAINERIVGEQGNILKKLKFSDESIKSISEGLKLGGEYALDAKSKIEKGLEGTDVANASPETKALIERLKTIGGEQNVFKRAGPLETENQGKPAWETSTAKLAEETLTGRIGSDEVLRRGKSDVMDKSLKEAQKAQEESKKAELEYQTYEAETAEMAKKGPIDPVEKKMRKEEAARLKQKSEDKKRDSQIASNKAKTAKESFEAFAADPTQSLSFLNDAKGKEAGLQKLEKSEDPNLKGIAEKARNLDKKKKELEDIRSQTTPKSTETKAREKQLEQEVATGSKELTSLGKRNSSAIKNTLYKDQVAPGISGLVQKPQDRAKVDAYNAKVVERQGLEGNLTTASKEVSDIEAKRIEREKVSKAFKATEGGPLTTEQRFTLAGRFNRGEITADEADKQSGGQLRKAYKSVNKTDEGFEDLNKTGNIKTKIGNRDQLQQSVDKAKSEESQLGKAMQPVLEALTGVANAQAAAVEADAARAQAEQDKKDGKGTEEAPAADGGEKKITSTSNINVTVTGGSLTDKHVAELREDLRKYSADTIIVAFKNAGLSAPNLGPPETTAVA